MVKQKHEMSPQEKADQELLKYLQKEFKRYDDDYKVRADGMAKWYRMVRGVLDTTTRNKHKSRLFLNKTKTAIFDGVSAIMDIIFPGTDFFDVVGRTEQDARGAETGKKVADWFVRLGDFIMKGFRYITYAAGYGTSFAKIRIEEKVDYVERKLPQVDINNQIIGYKNIEVRRVTRYPVLDPIDNFDIWTDPDGLGVENGESHGVFHRVFRSLAYLRSMEKAGIYRNIKAVEDSMQNKKKSDTRTSLFKDTRRQDIGLPMLNLREGEVQLFEYLGLVPREEAEKAGIEVKDDEFEVESVITIANMTTIIRAERNMQPGQDRMLISDMWEPPLDKSMHGIGIPESIRGPQLALNATINTRLDNKAWAIAAPILVDVSRIEDATDLVAKPNWVIRTKGKPDDIAKFESIPNLTQDAWAEAKEFERVIGDQVHLGPAAASGDFGSNRTAHGVGIAFSAASRPMRMIARGFETNLIYKGLKKMFKLFVHDLNEQMIIRITDDPTAVDAFLTIDPMSLSYDLDFVPVGSISLGMREQALDGLLRFIDGIGKVMPAIPPEDGRPNWRWLAEQFYRGLGLKSFDKAWKEGAPSVETSQGKPGAGTPPGAAGTPPAAGGTEDPRQLNFLALLGRMAQGQGGGGPQ